MTAVASPSSVVPSQIPANAAIERAARRNICRSESRSLAGHHCSCSRGARPPAPLSRSSCDSSPASTRNSGSFACKQAPQSSPLLSESFASFFYLMRRTDANLALNARQSVVLRVVRQNVEERVRTAIGLEVAQGGNVLVVQNAALAAESSAAVGGGNSGSSRRRSSSPRRNSRH